ncbi:nuclear transport factor 2 family protein [Gilvibacter sediminis]|uniref:nuclear transport factor 2 family protein n=1 Tax=Gilvibacter sediminis TaxID=379071 RepID=UPI0023504332|nr:nuclear transport factor 2 family protein [Gilvibacter sediminis]MDC7998041.1 nuclear transport factor 2 family protein [Gilvibacter sediminis]
MNQTSSKHSHKDLALLYLRKYAEKDLQAMEELFAEDIVLRDWKIRVVGKALALSETKKNFEAATSLTIEVLDTYENEDTVAAELKIVVNGTEELFVVDVMQFNAQGQIKAIRAYLGRGDD